MVKVLSFIGLVLTFPLTLLTQLSNKAGQLYHRHTVRKYFTNYEASLILASQEILSSNNTQFTEMDIKLANMIKEAQSQYEKFGNSPSNQVEFLDFLETHIHSNDGDVFDYFINDFPSQYNIASNAI
ncbi:hypothetical protein N9R79_03130 [Vibrio sp.]|nr:hypothetical protein [Vibrio sp.]